MNSNAIEKLAAMLERAGITARVDYGDTDVLFWPDKAKQIYRCVGKPNNKMLVYRKPAPRWIKVLAPEEAFKIIREAAR